MPVRGMQPPRRRCRIKAGDDSRPVTTGDLNLSGAANRFSAAFAAALLALSILAVPANATHIAGLPDNPLDCVADPLNCVNGIGTGVGGTVGGTVGGYCPAWAAVCPDWAAAFRELGAVCPTWAAASPTSAADFRMSAATYPAT